MTTGSKKTYKIAVLTSGHSRGSNFKAILKFIDENQLPIHVEWLMITDAQAPIADFCKEKGVPVYLYSTEKGKINPFILEIVQHNQIDCLVLAGFMRKISSELLDTIDIPVLNIHPALLPKYGGKGMYGMKVHEAVFNAGDEESGATVHLVNDHYDDGGIVLQEKIDISECQTPEEISQKVLTVEHKIYGPAIWKILNESPNS